MDRSMRAVARTPANDTNTISSLLLNSIKHCTNPRHVKRIQTHIITSPFLSNTDRHTLLNHLLFHTAITLSKSASSPTFSYTQRLFNSIQTPDLFAYNVMIRTYASKGDDEALKLYKQILVSQIRPDFVTFPFAFKVCCCKKSGCDSRDGFGRSLHCQAVVFGVVSDLYICNTLISFYASYGDLVDARKVFDEMLYRDIVSWNSIIIACLRCGELDEALGLFKGMSFVKNIVTWNSMITGFVQGGRAKEALELFHEMQVGNGVDNYIVRPDGITFANVITACGALGAIDHGKWVHGYLKKSDIHCDYVIQTALVDMYGKCGHLSTAFEVFSTIRNKDVLAWTAMISAFALHGHSDKAFEFFDKMISSNVRPSQVTFVSLLSACAHSGLVDKGRCYFNSMSRVYSLPPELHHYACMIDMLSRCSLFEEAERLIKTMPMKPDTFVLGALLRGCQMNGNVELGVKIANSLIELEPLNHVFYINLIDIYAKVGKYDDVKRIRKVMSDRGIKKEIAGCSLIEVDGFVHEFSICGSVDVMMNEVFKVLDVIYCEFRWIRDDWS